MTGGVKNAGGAENAGGAAKGIYYEVELTIIGSLLHNEEFIRDLFDIVTKHGLEPRHFTNPDTRAAYEAIRKTVRNANTGTVAGGLLCAAVRKALGDGGQKLLEAATGCYHSCLAQFKYDVKQLASSSRLQAEKEYHLLVAKKIDELNVPGNDLAAVIKNINSDVLDHAAKVGLEVTEAENDRTLLSEMSAPTEEEKEEMALIEGGWLRKGQAAMLVSVAGAGKSVMSMQIAYAWARGRPVFDIKPVKPLRIVIIQTEDDKVEMDEFRQSMRIGVKRYWRWSDADIAEAESRICLRKWRGNTGEAFVKELRVMLLEEKAACGEPVDLVILNPLLSFVGGNVADNENVTKFLRNGIDSVIKDERTLCGLLFIHHTGKPPQQNGRKGSGLDSQHAQYSGMGASELANYMRAVLTLTPHKQQPGEYVLEAAKRGQRLSEWKVNEELHKPHPSKLIRHAPKESGLTFWLEEKADADETEPTAAKKTPAAAKSTPDEDAARLAEILRNGELSLSEARKVAQKELGHTKSKIVFEFVRENPGRYGLKITNDPKLPAKKYIGPA